MFLKECKAVNHHTHWIGGPDWLAEVLSPDDKSRKKLDFYAKVGVCEILLIDRDPWAIELYQPQAEEMVLVGESSLERPDHLQSEVLPLTFCVVAGVGRPVVEVQHATDARKWHV